MHPSFFIIQLTEGADISEVKDEKARMHIVYPSFFILQLTESAEISEVKDEKLGCTLWIMAFSSFRSLRVLKSVSTF